eukprot:gnl/TRDRNA2_/TRDRNA2_164492_c0_seq5.p1 gnl/TRDRNA2_/TRDRNA2_164492_c0~~gnl/TRDRNA2_/TRDRNA2_164492_c0_seq5.p1  ORF type:complete len:209 (-),score=31.40 gnl/TRDRNA2_/TRDRNA2_164492_c0_seq5:617-1243(-)
MWRKTKRRSRMVLTRSTARSFVKRLLKPFQSAIARQITVLAATTLQGSRLQGTRTIEAGTRLLNTKTIMVETRKTSMKELTNRILGLFGIFPPTKATIGTGQTRRLSYGSMKTDLEELEAMVTEQQTQILATGVKAKALVEATLSKMAAKEVPEKVITWFGNNENSTRTEVKRVLNAIVEMMSNIDYIAGDQCQPQVYGYVYTGQKKR